MTSSGNVFLSTLSPISLWYFIYLYSSRPLWYHYCWFTSGVIKIQTKKLSVLRSSYFCEGLNKRKIYTFTFFLVESCHTSYKNDLSFKILPFISRCLALLVAILVSSESHQHGVSKRSIRDLGSTFIRVCNIAKIAKAWIVARHLAYQFILNKCYYLPLLLLTLIKGGTAIRKQLQISFCHRTHFDIDASSSWPLLNQGDAHAHYGVIQNGAENVDVRWK